MSRALDELATAIAEDQLKLGKEKELLIFGELFTCSSVAQAVRLSVRMREKMREQIILVARAEISRLAAMAFGRGCD